MIKNKSECNTDERIFSEIKKITSEDIKRLVPMTEAIDVMEIAFSSYSSGKSQVPHRYVSGIPDAGMDLFLKPAFSKTLGRIAVKILTQKKKGVLHGIPAIIGVVLLLDMETGAILSMIDGSYLTALRTGAASGIATKLLARENSEIIAVFGCGAQGRMQLEAACTIRPINQALLYDTDRNAAEKMRSEMEKKLDISIYVEKNVERLKNADIICTATNAKVPLFNKNDISKGVHINAIGSYRPDMQEVDPLILKSGVLFVDSIDSVLKESGDLIKPLRDGIFTENVVEAEIGELISSKGIGRNSDDDITIFKSVGLGVQDLFIADTIFNRFAGA